MGKLFWKFFLMFWLAQLVTMLGVGFAIDLKHRSENFDRFPPRFAQSCDPRPPRPQENLHEGPSQARPEGNQGEFGDPRSGPPPFDPNPINPPLRKTRLILPFEPLLAGFLVSLIFAAALAWYFSRPIRALREGFTALASGKLDTRLTEKLGKNNDELGDLGRAFDRMASQLGDLVGAQRRLLHDVSHELRSPLARLQAATGLARQQPDKLDVSMHRIEREALRMNRLIDELLTLSRLESGATMALNEDVDLGELLSGIVEDARFEATEADLTIELKGETSIRVRCQPEFLHRAVENLVRNAIKFSPAKGCVSLTVEKAEPSHFVLHVEDQGPGIPAEELEAVFEPFARSRNAAATGGYGLGLAIARRVVEAHGGSICAKNRPHGGLRVSILQPVSGRSEQA